MFPGAGKGTHSPLDCMSYIPMRMTPLKRLFRFAALALAAVQLTVAEGASIYEAFAVRSVGAAPSVRSPGTQPGAPAHDPGTCPACQTLNVFVRLPDASRLLPGAGHIRTLRTPADDAVPGQAVRSGFLSRAPPVLLG